MAVDTYVKRVASAVRRASKNNKSTWFTPCMDAAASAIAMRIPLVDFVLDVRDARIPVSSVYERSRCLSFSSHRIIVLNKMDLAKHSAIKGWIKYLDQDESVAYAVNSHNKESVKEFLNFLLSRVRALEAADVERRTFTMMLVGIPNVGKSALANSLHQIGRISSAEKGKLKHALVSPVPGETKSISSLKIASHPSVYVLDTPGLLSPSIINSEVCAKLALTGAFMDSLAGEIELAAYFLAVLNSENEYKKWAESPVVTDNVGHGMKTVEEQYHMDHTQDLVVRDVRRNLFEAVSSFEGCMGDERDLRRLIEIQFASLKEVFRLHMDSQEDAYHQVAVKLLNLYRTGRLGHYTLDTVPEDGK